MKFCSRKGSWGEAVTFWGLGVGSRSGGGEGGQPKAQSCCKGSCTAATPCSSCSPPPPPPQPSPLQPHAQTHAAATPPTPPHPAARLDEVGKLMCAGVHALLHRKGLCSQGSNRVIILSRPELQHAGCRAALMPSLLPPRVCWQVGLCSWQLARCRGQRVYSCSRRQEHNAGLPCPAAPHRARSLHPLMKPPRPVLCCCVVNHLSIAVLHVARVRTQQREALRGGGRQPACARHACTCGGPWPRCSTSAARRAAAMPLSAPGARGARARWRSHRRTRGVR